MLSALPLIGKLAICRHVPRRFYKSVDAFVLPSRGEGWGRPPAEVGVSCLSGLALLVSVGVCRLQDLPVCDIARAASNALRRVQWFSRKELTYKIQPNNLPLCTYVLLILLILSGHGNGSARDCN